MTSEREPTHSATTAEFGRGEPQRLSSPVPGWEPVQSLAKVPAGVPSGHHSHPGPELNRYVASHDVAIEFDDGANPTLRSGDPYPIPPGVISSK